MDTTLFQNILFVSLSIFLIFITVAFAICVIYIVLLLKHLIYFLQMLKKEGEKIASDIENVRGKVKSSSSAVASFIVSMFSFFGRNNKKSKEK